MGEQGGGRVKDRGRDELCSCRRACHSNWQEAPSPLSSYPGSAPREKVLRSGGMNSSNQEERAGCGLRREAPALGGPPSPAQASPGCGAGRGARATWRPAPPPTPWPSRPPRPRTPPRSPALESPPRPHWSRGSSRWRGCCRCSPSRLCGPELEPEPPAPRLVFSPTAPVAGGRLGFPAPAPGGHAPRL